MKAAHYNAGENLVVFATLVLVAQEVGVNKQRHQHAGEGA